MIACLLNGLQLNYLRETRRAAVETTEIADKLLTETVRTAQKSQVSWFPGQTFKKI